MVLPPSEWSFRFFVWIYWVLGSVGVWALARRMGAGPPVCAIATLALFGAGFNTAHVSQPPLFFPIIWITWVIFLIEGALRDHSLKGSFFAGAMLGFISLCCYPGLLPILGFVVIAWVLFRTFTPPLYPTEETRLKQRLKFTLVCSLIAGNTFLLVLSPSLLSYLNDTPGYTIRSGALDRETAVMSNRFTPQALASILSPAIPVASKASGRPEWAITDITGIGGYLSPVLLILLVSALIRVPRNRRILALAISASAILCLMTAMPDLFPLRAWLYDLIPPLRFSRHASIFVGIYASLLCITLAVAWPQAPTSKQYPRPIWLILAILLLVGIIWAWGLLAVLWHLHAPQEYWILALAAFILVWSAASTGLILTLTAKPALRTAGLIILVAAAAVDTLYHFHAMDRTMVNRSPQAVALWRSLEKSHNPSHSIASLDRIHTLLNNDSINSYHLMLKVPVLHGYTPINNPIYDQIISHSSMRQMLVDPNRILFAPAPLIIDTSTPQKKQDWAARLQEYLTKRPHEFPALVAPSPLAPTSLPPGSTPSTDHESPLPVATPIPVQLLEYTPNTLKLRVSPPKDGYLFVTDRWSPAWHATVNGFPVPTHQGLFVFRAIPVQKGDSILEMTYHSFGHPWLTIVSWSCLAIAAGMALFSSFKPLLNHLQLTLASSPPASSPAPK